MTLCKKILKVIIDLNTDKRLEKVYFPKQPRLLIISYCSYFIIFNLTNNDC